MQLIVQILDTAFLSYPWGLKDNKYTMFILGSLKSASWTSY